MTFSPPHHKPGVDMGTHDFEAEIDTRALRAWRLGRIQEQLRKRGLGGVLLYDPVNIRYATGGRNMMIWTMHNAARYVFVPAAGKSIMFEFPGCAHLAEGLDTLAEVRTSTGFLFAGGDRRNRRVRQWVGEILELVRTYCGADRRLAADHVDVEAGQVLVAEGVRLVEGQSLMEQARCIKSPEEISVMSLAIGVAETACARIREALEPGRTEAQMWSILQATNAEMGGEYIETKLLTSGARTNPWFQEAGEKRIRPGDLVSFDTDLVGPFGYDADMSRTYFCGPGRPSGKQRELYGLAFDEVHHNMSLLKAGLSFRDYAERAWEAPPNFHKNWYNGLIHGIGLCNEYPVLSKRFLEFDDASEAGFEENMLVCVESYIGEDDGVEGVKLEQMVRITATGVELMTTYPFDEQLLA